MPEPIYEYHLLYYSATGKLEPPLGGDWRIYKSKITLTTIGVTVLWRRPIEGPKAREVSEQRTLQVGCIKDAPQCQGPYGPVPHRCRTCSEYGQEYSSGKATFREMLEGCERLLNVLNDEIGPLPNGGADLEMVRAVRLHVNLHGYPAVTEDQRLYIETLFHALYSRLAS